MINLDRNVNVFSVVLTRLGMHVECLYRSHGCAACQHLGYFGRTGIFELLHMTNGLRSLIVEQPVFDLIYEQSCKDGMCTLLQDAEKKLQSGLVSLDELIRVLA